MKGKHTIVTGAGSGFGAGIAAACHAAGAVVGVLDLNYDAAKQVAERLGTNAIALHADVTDRASLSQAFHQFETHYTGIQVLINNAGLAQPPAPLEQVDEAFFDHLTAVNMKSIFHASQLLIPQMKAAGSGCILNIASTAGVSPRPNLTWYNATKGWVITATKSMAVELASSNIRVNAINPVAGETPMLATFLGEDSQARRQAFTDSIPLGRLSTPQDIAQAAVFLCSDAASMITGVALEVDGGRCI